MRRSLIAFFPLAAAAACVDLKPHRLGESPPASELDGGNSDGAAASDGASSSETGTNGPTGGSLAAVPDKRDSSDFETTIDDVVIDARTGLRWRRKAESDVVSFDEATAACAALRTEDAEGWRLPTKIELLAVADFVTTRAPDRISAWPSAFPNDSTAVWSSTERADPNPTKRQVAAVEFGTPGTWLHSLDATDVIWTRCVRGPRLARAKLVAMGDHLVRDESSGLVWERKRSPDPMDLDDAANRCEALSIDGVSDFRLPGAKELFSLFDDERASAPFDDAAFVEPRGGVVLTSTVSRNRSTVQAVDFGGAGTAYGNTGYVRCVAPGK